MIKAEWLKIFKTRKMLVSIIAVLFIPVMYAGMFYGRFGILMRGFLIFQ